MRTVNVHYAKTHLSKLLDEAAGGDAVVIARAGKPVARLGPLEPAEPRRNRRLGGLEGMFKVPDDFNTMFQKEIEEMFNGPDECATSSTASS